MKYLLFVTLVLTCVFNTACAHRQLTAEQQESRNHRIAAMQAVLNGAGKGLTDASKDNSGTQYCNVNGVNGNVVNLNCH